MKMVLPHHHYKAFLCVCVCVCFFFFWGKGKGGGGVVVWRGGPVSSLT